MTDIEDKLTGEPAESGQHVRELETLHLASHFLHRLRDPEVLARDVITLLKDVVHHDYAAVYLIDGDRLRTFAVSDRGLGAGVLDADKAYLESLDLRVGKNVTGWVAQHGESVRLDDATRDPRYLDSADRTYKRPHVRRRGRLRRPMKGSWQESDPVARVVLRPGEAGPASDDARVRES